MYTFSDFFGIGESTVCTIVLDVCAALIERLWYPVVADMLPHCDETFKDALVAMEQAWQFPYAFAAVDGCHVPIKCPPGGNEASKEYHNFKEFYSLVLMTFVDAK